MVSRVRGCLSEMRRRERRRKRRGRCARKISKNGEAGDNRRKIIAPPHEKQCGNEESC